MKPFKIRNIEINPPLVLSPMAGVTDYTFRRLIKRRGGVGLSVSEFISVEGLTRHNPKAKRQMRFDKEERPFAVQIFGGEVSTNGVGRGNGSKKSARIFWMSIAVVPRRKLLKKAAVRDF